MRINVLDVLRQNLWTAVTSPWVIISVSLDNINHSTKLFVNAELRIHICLMPIMCFLVVCLITGF